MMLLYEIKKESHWRFIMHIIETLDKLLKNELSATETYQQTLDILREDAELGDSVALMPIYENHKEAVSSLQAQIRYLGGTPAEDPGAWGTWAKIVLGGADLLGKETVLKALQEGEKNGAEDYEEALKITELSLDIRSLIETKLLPDQQGHIRTLDRLLGAETE
jgi:bacterioferritin (cytochrome b1)